MQPIKPKGPGPEVEFKAYLKEGRFMIQKSSSTGEHVFYPRVAAPGSGKTDLEWVEASGEGTIYSITVGRSKTGGQNVAIVELAEGPRMMTRIEGVETAPIGAKVKARIADIDGAPAIVFDLAEGGKA
ncbi:MAG: OB-fold domain-containing protein [Hyphomicrobiaceae bacterium]